MQLELLTLSGTKFSGEVESVVATTAAGAIAVYANHEPLTTIVSAGTITVHLKNGKSDVFTTFGGVLEVENNVCRILSDESEHSEELIEQEIEAALASAEKLKQNSKDKHELAHAQALVDRHTVRLNVARMKRSHSAHRADKKEF